MAWDKVKPETVIKCFKRTGAFPEDEESEEDPFAGLDNDGDEDTSSLDDLVHHFDVDTTADDYVNADDCLDTNLTFEDSDNWREKLRYMACDRLHCTNFSGFDNSGFSWY